jgi:hypothetical protein
VQYKFVVDGVWRHDSSAPFVTDKGGNANNTVTTAAPPTAAAAQLPPPVSAYACFCYAHLYRTPADERVCAHEQDAGLPAELFSRAGSNATVRVNELRNMSRCDFQGTFGVLAQPRDCDIASVSFTHVAGDACNFVGVCRPGGMRADADVLQGGFWTLCLRDGAVTLDGVSKARVPEWVAPALNEAVHARHDFVRGQFVVEVGTRSYEFSTGVTERALRLCLAAAKGNAIRIDAVACSDAPVSAGAGEVRWFVVGVPACTWNKHSVARRCQLWWPQLLLAGVYRPV